VVITTSEAPTHSAAEVLQAVTGTTEESAPQGGEGTGGETGGEQGGESGGPQGQIGTPAMQVALPRPAGDVEFFTPDPVRADENNVEPLAVALGLAGLLAVNQPQRSKRRPNNVRR
jgi:hypothetical protein